MMRPYGEDLKVYLCREPVDMRKGRNGCNRVTTDTCSAANK